MLDPTPNTRAYLLTYLLTYLLLRLQAAQLVDAHRRATHRGARHLRGGHGGHGADRLHGLVAQLAHLARLRLTVGFRVRVRVLAAAARELGLERGVVDGGGRRGVR